MNKLLYILILIVFASCQKQQRAISQSDKLHFNVQKTLIEPDYYDSETSILPEKGVIPNDSTAIKIGETILFNVYGERNIVKQRPYNIVLKQDSIWCIQGTLSSEWDGGVFYIELNKNTGKVEKIFHDK